MQVLVGDIGGTKTGLALAQCDGDRVTLSLERRYPSRDAASLADIVERFRAETGAAAELGSFAVAGPVMDGRSRTTNLPWKLDEDALAQRLGLRRVRLLNDLEAVAWGIPALDDADLDVLQTGAGDATGNACVVAAGTGLGQAGLYWDGRRHHPFASEGGHADFAAIDAREQGLLAHLQARFGRVSWERVVSGQGIGNIYGFLAERHGIAHAPAIAAALAGDGDVAAEVAATAATGCPVCNETLDLFMRLYGRECGNAALKYLALGGVYLGGGIAPKNLERLHAPGFLDGFLDKGRMRDLMERMPVRVILNPHTPLLGAARFVAAA
jgi:glucokinase